MNILVLMPLDEAQTFTQHWLQRRVNKLDGVTSLGYSVFADYLLEVNKVKNWEEAIIYTYPSVNRFAEIAKKDGNDVVYLGNAPKDIKMNLVVGLDLNGKGEISYKLIGKMKEKYKGTTEITKKLDNLYSPDDCENIFTDKELLLEFVKKILDK